MRIAILSASLSESSTATTLGRRIVSALNARVPVTESWIDLRPLGHPLVDTLLSGFPSRHVEECFGMIRRSDAIISVSPVYQASYSALFKLFVDVVPQDLFRGKPVVIGATGGTARHGLVIDHSLRPLFAYLGAVPAPTGVYAATQDWGGPG